jgi:NAD-dependent dihydropyrimidine dehydrogenase PreA subunit
LLLYRVFRRVVNPLVCPPMKYRTIDIVCATLYTENAENRFELLCQSTLMEQLNRRIARTMTYVITQPCIGVKDASCVDVCPVDCIHPSQGEEGYEENEQLYINPDECIDCGACEPACPVTAIFEESAVPEEWKSFIKINADFFKG